MIIYYITIIICCSDILAVFVLNYMYVSEFRVLLRLKIIGRYREAEEAFRSETSKKRMNVNLSFMD